MIEVFLPLSEGEVSPPASKQSFAGREGVSPYWEGGGNN